MKQQPLPTYPVALDREIHPGGLVRSALLGTDLVIWRCNQQQVHVWRDNCPHRSVRLSAGRNRGDSLESPYHGWRYRRDGRLHHIPAMPGQDLPEVFVQVLSSTISSGLVWASLGDAKPPANFEMTADECLIRPLHVSAPSSKVADACAALPDIRLTVASVGAAASCIYGFALRRRREADIDAARRANNVLTAMRRQVEALQ